MNIYKKLFHYVPEKKIEGIGAIVFSLLSAVLICLGYYYLYEIIEKIIIAKDLTSASTTTIYAIIALTLGGISYILSATLSHIVAFRLETNLKKKGIEGLINASFRFFDQNQSGIIRKTIDDNTAMTHQSVAHMIPDMGQAFVIPILAIVLAFIVSIRVGIVIAIMVAIALFLMMKMTSGGDGFMNKYQNALNRMSGETVEYVRGIQVIKIFKADVKSFKSLHEAILSYAKYAYEYSKSCKIPYVVYQWLFYTIVAIVILMMTLLNKKPVDSYIAVELIMLLFISGIIMVTIMKLMWAGQYIFQSNFALEKLEKIYEDMNKDRLKFGKSSDFDGYDIEFKDVSFSYGDNSVLDNLSFKLDEGKTYALVGSSGSGKSTIAKLISGFYKIDGGSILIGDKPIENYSEEAVASSISFVFQDSRLFKKSIYDNVAIAKKDVRREEVMRALSLAGCDEIIEKFSTRENTIIGSKGVHLSGGEVQRLAIARAILKDAPIVIMDEASASIDADNEYKLQLAFKNLMKDKTVIMIAHRLSSIENVDEILVVSDGRIIERGSHDELIKANGEYKKQVDLYNSTNDWRLSDERAF